MPENQNHETSAKLIVEALDGGRILSVALPEMASGDEFRLFLFSDIHFDSRACDRAQLRRDLENAAQNGYIAIIGDIFDAMQGRYDPRRSWPGMRKEYAEKLIGGGSYYDVIVEDATAFFAPFAKKILFISYGNHETSVLSRSDTDLLQRLAAMLNLRLQDWRVHVGAYAGYVYFQFRTRKTVQYPLILRYHHGYGGDAPVTRGVIQTNRQAVDYPDADVIINGHNHQSYVVVVPRERFIVYKGRPMTRNDAQYYVRTPAYATQPDPMGWETQTGKSPRVSGYVSLHVVLSRDGLRLSAEVVSNR